MVETDYNHTPPKWVTKATYMHDDFAGGQMSTWWASGFRNEWEIDQSQPGKVWASRRWWGGDDRLTPESCRISGNFTFDFRTVFESISSFTDAIYIAVRRCSDASLVCSFGLTSKYARWDYGASANEDVDLTGFQEYEGIWLRISRTGNTITAYYYDEFLGSYVGSYTFNWIALTNTVTPVTEDVYLTVNGQDGGFSELRLQADGGLKHSLRPYAVVNTEVMSKCLHYAMKPEHGGGWSEVSGTAWLWPANQAAVMSVISEGGFRHLVIHDRASGMWYIANTKDGPSGSGLVWRNKDKVDPNDSTSGTDIAGSIVTRRYVGDSTNYTVVLDESLVRIGPRKPANIGASGYDAYGLLSGQQFDASAFADESETAYATETDVESDREIHLRPKQQCNGVQFKIAFLKSDFRLQSMLHFLTVRDVPRYPREASGGRYPSPNVLQSELASPIFWLSRDHGNPLLDRASGATVAATATTTTGPDSRTGSAISLTV